MMISLPQQWGWFQLLDNVLGDVCIDTPLVHKFRQWCTVTMCSMWHWGQGLYKVFLTDLLFLCSDTHTALNSMTCIIKFACLDTKWWILMPDVMPRSLVEECWHCRGLATSMIRVGDGDTQLHWNVGILLLHYVASADCSGYSGQVSECTWDCLPSRVRKYNLHGSGVHVLYCFDM